MIINVVYHTASNSCAIAAATPGAIAEATLSQSVRDSWSLAEGWLRAEPEVTAKALTQRLRDQFPDVYPTGARHCVLSGAACGCGAMSRSTD
jgi:hypothetical protein